MMDIMEPYFYCVNSYSQIDMHLKYSIQDPDDFHLYQAATIAEVDYIVTINGRDLKGIKDRLESRGTKVINLKEFKHLMITRIQAI